MVGQQCPGGPLSKEREGFACSHLGDGETLAQRWGFGEGKAKLLTGSPWHCISSCTESAEELKKYLYVLQRKKAWNCRNSLSLATTISKGNPGTASLWRRILEIFSEPRSNKEQKRVFVMSTSRMLFPSLHPSGNHDSPQSAVFLNDI